jgi:hypothetical protein
MADQRETGQVNRKTAYDGITESKQSKCIFDVQFHIICIQISFTNFKNAILLKIVTSTVIVQS